MGGVNVKAGNVIFWPLSLWLVNSRRYRDAKRSANKRRKRNVLEPQEEAEGKSTREELVEAYRIFNEEQTLTASCALPLCRESFTTNQQN